jgi:hypothetical protein
MNLKPFFIPSLLISCLALLVGCPDARNVTEGTPTALANYDVASRGIERRRQF